MNLNTILVEIALTTDQRFVQVDGRWYDLEMHPKVAKAQEQHQRDLDRIAAKRAITSQRSTS